MKKNKEIFLKQIDIKKYISIFCIIIASSILLSSCFNYKDINKVIFATAVVYDTDDNGDVVVYYDCIKPYRSSSDSSEKGKRQVYTGKGKTVLEAIQKINMSTSHEVDFSQCTTYIFTEKASKEGIANYIDVMNREQKFAKRPVLFVYYGDIKELLSNVSEDEESVGAYVSDLVNKTKTTPASIVVTFNDYLTMRTMDYDNVVIGALVTKKDLDGTRMQLGGGCIFNDDVLQDRISEEETILYKFINDNVSSGIFIVENPLDQDKNITLEIIESNTDTNVKYAGEYIQMSKNMWIKANISETDGEFNNDKQVVELVKKKSEMKMQEDLMDFFDKYKKKHIDIFNISRLVDNKYKQSLSGGNLIDKTTLNIDVNIDIAGTGVVMESF